MNIMLVEPSTVPGFESFPGATVAEVGNEAAMFWRTTADGIYLLGSLSEGIAITNSDEGKYFQYPAPTRPLGKIACSPFLKWRE